MILKCHSTTVRGCVGRRYDVDESLFQATSKTKSRPWGKGGFVGSTLGGGWLRWIHPWGEGWLREILKQRLANH
jgi:hypothetical protein